MAQDLRNVDDRKIEEIVSSIISGVPIVKKFCKCNYEFKGFEKYCPMCGKKIKEKAKKEKKIKKKK